MLSKFTYDNVVKGLIAVSLLFMAFGANAAGFQGKVGIASDNYFRGVNMSNGVGYTASGSYGLENGIWAGAGLMSLDDSSEQMTKLGVGYNFDIGAVSFGVAYIDYGFNGIDAEGWEEVGISADFDVLEVSYFNGLDDAGDFYKVSSSALKFIDVAYGDSDLAGSYFELSKSFDLALGSVKVGYIDHEDNEDDFADRVFDADNFYVGYSIKF